MSEILLVEQNGSVATLTLNRPEVHNALSNELLGEIVDTMEALDGTDETRVIILTGGPKVFAAGADLNWLSEQTPEQFLESPRFVLWGRLWEVNKPIITAVSGVALGAGCELAMSCDLIIASETARFGQPEINVGIMPGAGGTQRLARAVGKVRAMEMVLTGDMLTAADAERLGLINRVVPVENLAEEAMTLAQKIASKPSESIRLAKESVRKAFETHLTGGLAFERGNFLRALGTDDAHEGMRAFLDKREPKYRGH